MSILLKEHNDFEPIELLIIWFIEFEMVDTEASYHTVLFTVNKCF